MSLTVCNQLTLLHDLLYEHIKYRAVTLNEYKKIKELVQLMINNREIRHELQHILPEIYCYGLKGETAQSISSHIIENELKIKYWLLLIDRLKLNLSS